MRHLILTRSVHGPATPLDVNRRRLELLRGVTAASLRAQTERDFLWVVAVHPEDPLLEYRLAACIEAGVTVCSLRFQPSADAQPARIAALAYKADWRSAFEPSDKPLLTTRLDDDDALAPDAVERIQRAVNPLYAKCRSVLMLPQGYRVHAGRYEPVRHERNAWATLQAPAGDDAVIYDYNHKRIVEELDVRLLGDRPGWLWVRHRDTLSGHKSAEHPIDDELRDQFPGIDWALLEETEPANASASK